MLKLESFKACCFPIKANIALKAYLYMAVLALNCYIAFRVAHAAGKDSLKDL